MFKLKICVKKKHQLIQKSHAAAVPSLPGLTASTTDLDTVANATAIAMANPTSIQHEAPHQYSLHRLYATRKLSTNSSINSKFTNHETSGMTHSQSTGDVASIFGRA